MLWMISGGRRQAQVGCLLISDADVLRPLRLHAARHHPPGPQMFRLDHELSVCARLVVVLGLHIVQILRLSYSFYGVFCNLTKKLIVLRKNNFYNFFLQSNFLLL